jgi:hypothetical protein
MGRSHCSSDADYIGTNWFLDERLGDYASQCRRIWNSATCTTGCYACSTAIRYFLGLIIHSSTPANDSVGWLDRWRSQAI